MDFGPTATTATNTTNTTTTSYIASLSPKEQKAYNIAKDHLKTSFDLEKAQGYKKWLISYSQKK
jgi:predicted transcriptional regulator